MICYTIGQIMEQKHFLLIEQNIPHFRLRSAVEEQFALQQENHSKSWKTAMATTGMVGLVLALTWQMMHDHEATVGFRTLAQQDILQGASIIPLSAEKYIVDNEKIISNMEEKYELPSGVLRMLVSQEIGGKDKKTFLGLEPLSEQFLKAVTNDMRSKLGDSGDMSRDKKYHLGLSFGLLNIKPGLINLAVIDNLRNPNLQKQLLGSYDYRKFHASDAEVRDLAEDFGSALELTASYMNLWKPYLLEYAEAQNFSIDKTQRLFALLISTFPQEKENNEGENHYAWLARDGFPTPDFMDKSNEP
mgnify:CR=1 FL=1